MTKTIEIVHVNEKSAADVLVAQGYEAIECSFGHFGSSLGNLAMDHHGSESHREGVALRAYRDHFGSRKDDPRFVVTGAADADATFAIAALCGMLPHPSRATEFEKAPPPVKTANTKDISGLASLVNKVDTAPIGVRLEETDEGVTLLLWNQMGSSAQDATAFHAGVDRWRALLGRAPKALLAAAKVEEQNRVTEARKAEVIKLIPCRYCDGDGAINENPYCCSETEACSCCNKSCRFCRGSGDPVAVVESAAWGFDVWYAEVAPIIVAYVAANGNITVGCPDVETAEKFFGPGGLKNVFAKLEPSGWGGREAIGGSPRGQKLTREQAVEAAKVIATAIVADPDDDY